MEELTSNNIEVFYALPGVDFLAFLPEEELFHLAKRFKRLRARKGEVICRGGDPGDSLFIIKSGIVDVYVRKEGREDLIAQLHRGDFFGERAILTGEPRMATVKAALDVELFELKKADFEALLYKHPQVALHISRIISSRFSKAGGLITPLVAPCFYSVIGSHAGLGCSTFTAMLAVSVAREAGGKVLVIDLDEPRGQVLHILGGEQIDCPDNRLIEDFSPETRANLRQSWYKSPAGVTIFQLPQTSNRKFVTEIRSHLSSIMEVLKNNFAYVFFDLHHEINTVSKRVLRLSDCILFLIPTLVEDMADVPQQLRLIQDIIDSTSARIKIGTSHIRGDTGLHRTEIKALLNLAEVPEIWQYKEEEKNRTALRRLAREICKRRVGVALGAGGARGWTHLGVLKALEERGIPIDMIAGCSIGAFVAALYGKTGSANAAIELALSYFSTTRQVRKNIYDYTLLGGGVLKGNRILSVLEEMLEGADFLDLAIPVSIIAVDMATGQEVIMERGSVSKAVRASISSPGMFNPFNMNGQWLSDGALLNPLPVDVLVNKGADFLLASVVERRTGERWPENRGPSILGVLTRSFSIMFSHAARESINKSDIVIYPDVEGYKWGDFHLGKELIRRGEEACLQKIDEIEKLMGGELPAVGSQKS
ncbi:MAG: cyclic nucleotide-binding domain-containing protein [Thermodesulfobacteriota bacterium]|nr:cyclic nucleotide-binding domain-containing protein [Thermodesulfobacteriota bacterium]